MDSPEVFTGITNFGLAGMLFYMWWVNNRKETGLQQVIEQQVQVINLLRDERTEFVRLLKEASAVIAVNNDHLAKCYPTQA